MSAVAVKSLSPSQLVEKPEKRRESLLAALTPLGKRAPPRAASDRAGSAFAAGFVLAELPHGRVHRARRNGGVWRADDLMLNTPCAEAREFGDRRRT